MITKVKKDDGTIIEFDREYTINSIHNLLLKEGNLSEEIAKDLAINVIDNISKRGGIPSTKDFESLIQLVIKSMSLSNSSNSTANNQDNTSSQVVEKPNDEDNSGQSGLGNDVTGTLEIQKDLKKLDELGIKYSEQARKILDESKIFDELGRSIFLDRYAIKSKRDDIKVGDLIVAISKEDRRFPKKDLGIVKSIDSENDLVVLHMITGNYADEANNYEFKVSLMKCDKPIESIKDAHKRVAKAASSVEASPELQNKWEQKYFDALSKKYIQPAGRIMTGANIGEGYTKNLTLYNCYVIPSPKDSRGGIVRDTLYQMTEIFSRGGGVGINLSTLRPKYSYVQGVHGKSSGAVSWGGLYSFGTGLIEQGGSRRGALMLMLHDWHPDIMDFITAKRKKGVLENANISVLVSDKFMDCLAKGGDWELQFPDYEAEGMKEIYNEEWDGRLDAWKAKGYPVRSYGKMKAADIWNTLISSAHASAEPGIVFMERYNKMSNSNYFNPIICTNPCGEQGLPAWGVCNLGHLHLASFAKQVGTDEVGAVYEVDWGALKDASRTLIRFLDNIIDLTPYHFKANEENQKGERRVGAGTLGLGELLIKLRVRYGSPESLEVIDKIYKTICVEAYDTSIELAQEKGMFSKCEPEKIVESGFIKTLPEELREKIRQHGLRNVTLITQAPTGTVGTMNSTSTGIEPYYAFEFFQQSRLGFHKVKIPLAKEYMREDGTLPDWMISAMEMTPLDHIRVQGAVQRWTDSSISKTANAPENFTVEETKQLYEEAYRLGCKGVTIYRDNCRYEQVLTTDASTEQKNVSGGDWEASNKVENATEPNSQAAKSEESGAKCELKLDENGQMYKSCSD